MLKILRWTLSLLLIVACNQKTSTRATENKEETKAPEFAPDWKSLGKHKAAPEWFKEAKLGIYFHWGLYSVPAFDNEWYPRHMHFKDHKVYKHHVEKYGEPSEFGYHDFEPEEV